jgi:hypothetical protein
MRHFDETKPFGTVMVGAATVGVGYQTGLPDWIVLFSLPMIIMAVYWLIIDHAP